MKLDLKELVNKITSAFTVSQTQEFTACGKTWTFRRVGSVVYLDAPADIRTASQGLNTIGTLPIGMRPSYIQRLHIGNSTIGHFLQISPSGLVQLYAISAITAAQNCSFSTSFIVGGYYVAQLLQGFWPSSRLEVA